LRKIGDFADENELMKEKERDVSSVGLKNV
jgi:hypothetical protein